MLCKRGRLALILLHPRGSWVPHTLPAPFTCRLLLLSLPCTRAPELTGAAQGQPAEGSHLIGWTGSHGYHQPQGMLGKPECAEGSGLLSQGGNGTAFEWADERGQGGVAGGSTWGQGHVLTGAHPALQQGTVATAAPLDAGSSPSVCTGPLVHRLQPGLCWPQQLQRGLAWTGE